MQRGGTIYFMTNNHNTVLYTCVTSNLQDRIQKHKSKNYPDSFTARYNCDKLVYYESFATIEEAIAREKSIKNWKREWKNALISSLNPDWKDLSEEVMNW